MGKHGLNQSELVEAAARLAEEKGLEHLTLRDLADSFGVKTASLYNHLNGLSELHTRLAELGLVRLEEALRNAAVGQTQSDALSAIATAYRQFAQESPELYKAIHTVPALQNGQAAESALQVTRLFRQVLASYSLGEAEALHFNRIFRSGLHGFVSLEQAGFFQQQTDADESYRRLVQTLLRPLQEPESVSPRRKEGIPWLKRKNKQKNAIR